MRLAVCALLLVTACAAPSPEPQPTLAPEPSAAPSPAPPKAEVIEPDLCDDLRAIIDGRQNNFTDLRGSGDGWTYQARRTPLGLNSCEIEGNNAATARYVCTSNGYREGDLQAPQAFTELSAKISHCLTRQQWSPRQWLAGESRVFADDERQIIWRDIGTLPRQRIELKLERDFIAKALRLRLEFSPRSTRPNLGS